MSALHVNYGLRDEAGDDEQLCRELCERLGVGLTVESVSAPREGNLQAWARDVRYGLGAQLATAAGARLGSRRGRLDAGGGAGHHLLRCAAGVGSIGADSPTHQTGAKALFADDGRGKPAGDAGLRQASRTLDRNLVSPRLPLHL